MQWPPGPSSQNPSHLTPPRLPSVQTTCSSGYSWTVVCTLVRLGWVAHTPPASDGNGTKSPFRINHITVSKTLCSSLCISVALCYVFWNTALKNKSVSPPRLCTRTGTQLSGQTNIPWSLLSWCWCVWLASLSWLPTQWGEYVGEKRVAGKKGYQEDGGKQL